MGFCVVGDVVIAPNQIEKQSHYHENQPNITYNSNSADEAYWGYSYTTFENAYSMVDGSYTIFQSTQSGCGLDQQIKYDCINGACIKSEKYETPGLYNSLEECQMVCGEKGCSGECISHKEWSQIKDLAGKLKNKNCS